MTFPITDNEPPKKLDKADEIIARLERFNRFIDLFLERADPKTKQLYGECHREVFGF